jgi:hypothetical protein
MRDMIVNGYHGFGALPLFNPVLAQAARGAIASQGLNPNIVTPQGELDAQMLLTLAFDEIEVRSTLGNFTINLNSPSSPATQALIDRIKPTLVFKGRAGEFTVAPYGAAQGIDKDVESWGWKAGVGIGAGILGLLLIGKAFF